LYRSDEKGKKKLEQQRKTNRDKKVLISLERKMMRHVLLTTRSPAAGGANVGLGWPSTGN
jgi:hypothetical protein